MKASSSLYWKWQALEQLNKHLRIVGFKFFQKYSYLGIQKACAIFKIEMCKCDLQ